LLAASPGWRSPGSFEAIDVPSGKVRFPGAAGYLLLGLSRDGRVVLSSNCVYGYLGHQLLSGGVETIPLNGGRPRTLVRGACSASWNR